MPIWHKIQVSFRS